MDEIFRAEWVKIFRRFPSEGPSMERFKRRFGQYITAKPQHLNPLTLARIKSTIKRMKAKSAASRDGWGVADLKQLPDAIRIKLVAILNTIEEGDEWPKATLEAIVALLPKDDT